MAPSKGRPRCFFDVSIAEVPAGRIIFELFSDICPLTTENFRALCTGEKGVGEVTEKPLHYRGTKIHRVVKDFIIQGGDFSAGNGTGGESVYGGTFADETFDMKHDKPFLLSMANRGKDTNGSQFFLTTKPAPHLDGLHVVFGHVIDGEDVVTKIESQRTDAKSRPLVEIMITNCGEMVLQVKPKEVKKKKRKLVSSDSSSETESSGSTVSESSELTPSSQIETESTDSEEERRRKKKKKKKLRMKIRRKRQRERRKQKKKQKLEQGNGDGEGKPIQSEIAPNVTIDPEEIPDIPAHNFLTRVPMEKKDEPASSLGDSQYRPPASRSGRKIKGRGNIRYRTPTGSDSHSPTPQYWKSEANRQLELQRGWDIDATRRYITTGKTEDKWEKGSALKEERYRSRDRNRDRGRDYSSPEDSRSWRHERRDSSRYEDSRYEDGRYDDHHYDDRKYDEDEEYEDDYYDRSRSERKKKKKDKEKSKEKKSSKKRKHRSHQKSSDSLQETPSKFNGNGEKERGAEDDDDSPPPTHWKQGQKPWKPPEIKGSFNDLYKDLVPPSKKLRHPVDIFNDKEKARSKGKRGSRSRSPRSHSSSSDDEDQSLESLSASRKRLLEKMKTLEQEKHRGANWQPPEEDESIEVTMATASLREEGKGVDFATGKGSHQRLVSYHDRTEEKRSPPQEQSDQNKQVGMPAASDNKDGGEKKSIDGGHPKAPEDTPASPTSEPEEGIFAGAPVVIPAAIKKTIPIVIEKSRWEMDEESSPVEVAPTTTPPKKKEPSKFIPLKPAEPVVTNNNNKPKPAVAKPAEAKPVGAPAKPTVVVTASVTSTNQKPTRVVTMATEADPVVVIPDSSQPAKVPLKKSILAKGTLGSEIKKKRRRLRERKSWTRSPSNSPERSVSRSRSRSRSPRYHRESRRDHKSRYSSRSPSSRSRSRERRYKRHRFRSSYSRSRSLSRDSSYERHHRDRRHSNSSRSRSRSPYSRSRSRSRRRERSKSHDRGRSPRSRRSRSRRSRSRSYSSRSRSSRSRSRSYSRSRSRSRS